MKFMRLLLFGTVMLMSNGAGTQNSVKPFHLDEATISVVHAAYKSGALTSVRLVQAYLERIRASVCQVKRNAGRINPDWS